MSDESIHQPAGLLRRRILRRTSETERTHQKAVARSKTSTGLGLSIAKELVSRMDGEIEAKIEKKEFIVEMNFPIVTDAK